VIFAANDPVEMQPLIVTASRTAQTADQTLASVSVVTRADIERSQALSVPDLLRGMRGISVTNNGGPGKVSTVLMRGTESDHVLVLMDGIKIGNASAGTSPFEHIPLDQIERIEIVRGPRSSLYGSEAVGGVIQIFTRKGGGPLTPSLSIGAGSYATYRASANLAGGGDSGWFNLSASGVDTEGFDACNGEPLVAGCFTIEPDRDGYANRSSNLRAGYRLGDSTEVDVHWLHTEGDTQYDGEFVNESETVQQIVGGNFRWSPLLAWNIALAAGRSSDDSDNFKDGRFMTRFDTRRDTASLQNDIAVGADRLISLGVDYQHDSIDSSEMFTVTSRDNAGLFAQYQGGVGHHDIQASVRLDDNEQFGSHTTGGLAWGYEMDNGPRVTASCGTAFKAPSFNELYFPGFGNPALDPEASASLEVGLSNTADWGDWSLNAYQTDIDDMIAFDSTTFAPANIGSARIRGLEAALRARRAGWDLNVNLTLLDPANRSSGAYQGNRLPRRAKQSLRMDLDRPFGRYNLGASLVAEGKRYDDLANTVELDGYVTVDLRAEYLFPKAWRLQARVENLFDENYETAAFYNQPGRGLYLTLRYQP
jgi:vitamin B12 transporter